MQWRLKMRRSEVETVEAQSLPKTLTIIHYTSNWAARDSARQKLRARDAGALLQAPGSPIDLPAHLFTNCSRQRKTQFTLGCYSIVAHVPSPACYPLLRQAG